jgi:hypothetical protein
MPASQAPDPSVLSAMSPGSNSPLGARGTAALRLLLANRQFVIEGFPTGGEQLLPSRLRHCIIARPAACSTRVVRLRISAAEHLSPKLVSDREQREEMVSGAETVSFSDNWYEGLFATKPQGLARLHVHERAGPWFGGIIENLLRMLLAYDLLDDGGVLLHCAAIVHRNRAAVLFGHSGAGKSTVSQRALEAGWSVVSDDLNIIEPGADGWQVTPVPFSGTLNARSDIDSPVPLDGLYRLHKAPRNRLRACTPARAMSLLAGSAPFVNQDLHRSAKLLDNLCRLTEDLGVKDLYFTLEDAFLKLISDADTALREHD